MVLKAIYVGATALTVCGVMFAAETFEEYQTVMRAGAGANGEMRKLLESDLNGAAAAAERAKTAFEEIEAYWKAKGADDAVGFAHNIVVAAEEVRAAAAAGNREAAVAASQSIGANCGSCHNAHRVRDANGNWTIK